MFLKDFIFILSDFITLISLSFTDVSLFVILDFFNLSWDFFIFNSDLEFSSESYFFLKTSEVLISEIKAEFKALAKL